MHVCSRPAKQIFGNPPADKATTWSLYDMWLGINTRKLDAPPVKVAP